MTYTMFLALGMVVGILVSTGLGYRSGFKSGMRAGVKIGLNLWHKCHPVTKDQIIDECDEDEGRMN